jgi:hypothetical protein
MRLASTHQATEVPKLQSIETGKTESELSEKGEITVSSNAPLWVRLTHHRSLYLETGKEVGSSRWSVVGSSL